VTKDLLRRFYDRYPDIGYYLRRGTWAGDVCDILAIGGELDDATLAFGTQPRRNPLAGIDTEYALESWIDYAALFDQLLKSPAFSNTFERCLAVQEEVENAVERYRGRRDQRWLLRDGTEAIVEIKTGLVLPFTRLQTAFYDMADCGPRHRARYAVELRLGHKPKLHQFREYGDYEAARLRVRDHWKMREYE
jgi:hypothetical protein